MMVVMLMFNAVYAFKPGWPTNVVSPREMLGRMDDHTATALKIHSNGANVSSFDRRLPLALHTDTLKTMCQSDNILVNMSLDGSNKSNEYMSDGNRIYIAQVRNATVFGPEGDVCDMDGNVYRMSNATPQSIETLQYWHSTTSLFEKKSYDKLAVVVHKLSFMYFHNFMEGLSRVAIMVPMLMADPTLKIMTYGGKGERQWLDRMGIPRNQCVVYNPTHTYYINTMYFPTPADKPGHNSREGFAILKAALDADHPPLQYSERNVVIYVTRRYATERNVTNESEMIAAVNSTVHPLGLDLVFYHGNLSTQDTIDLFRRARVVFGPNGAGMSHIIFCAPGTIVIEMIFMRSWLDFWHPSIAMDLVYYISPLPRSWWLDPGTDAPISELVGTIRLALAQKSDHDTCPPGNEMSTHTKSCTECASGTFGVGHGYMCEACSMGFVSSTGSNSCHFCEIGTYSRNDSTCEACKPGYYTVMPGSSTELECVPIINATMQWKRQYPSDKVIKKTSAVLSTMLHLDRKLRTFEDLPHPIRRYILSETEQLPYVPAPPIMNATEQGSLRLNMEFGLLDITPLLDELTRVLFLNKVGEKMRTKLNASSVSLNGTGIIVPKRQFAKKRQLLANPGVVQGDYIIQFDIGVSADVVAANVKNLNEDIKSNFTEVFGAVAVLYNLEITGVGLKVASDPSSPGNTLPTTNSTSKTDSTSKDGSGSNKKNKITIGVGVGVGVGVGIMVITILVVLVMGSRKRQQVGPDQ
jgi:hypothetical protein